MAGLRGWPCGWPCGWLVWQRLFTTSEDAKLTAVPTYAPPDDVVASAVAHCMDALLHHTDAVRQLDGEIQNGKAITKPDNGVAGVATG